MQDASSIIVHIVAKILDINKAVQEKLDGYLDTKMERPDISYELLKTFVLADNLIEFVNPSKTAGEIFGLPKDAVVDSRKPFKFSNQKGWDFSPWFLEKATYLKDGIKEAYSYWEKDPNEVKLPEKYSMTAKEWVMNGMFRGLNQVKAYAEAIFEMTYHDKVLVNSEED